MAPGRIPFLLGQATPHAVRLAGPQGKGQALSPDRAPGADLFVPRYLLDGRPDDDRGKNRSGSQDWQAAADRQRLLVSSMPMPPQGPG
jgi:hypothetical protein